jgi:hypothetical protein
LFRLELFCYTFIRLNNRAFEKAPNLEVLMSNVTAAGDMADDFGFATLAPGVDLSGLHRLQREPLWILLTLGNVKTAAKSAGVDRNEVVNWIRHDQRFRDAFKAARERLIAANEARIAAETGGAPAAALEDGELREERRVPAAVLRLLRIV